MDDFLHLISPFSTKMLFLPVVILLVALVSVAIAKRLGLGVILGLLLTGIVIGPHTPGALIPANYVGDIMHFSELGIVLLLFIVGLEMQPKRLWSMRKEVLGTGTAQILLSGLLLGLYFFMTGYNWRAALVIGLTLALSSTAFVLQILQENQENSSEHGRIGFAILLMQDLAIVPLLAMVSFLASTHDTAEYAPIWLQPFLVIGAMGLVFLMGRVIAPWVLDRFVSYHNKASFVLFAIFMVAFSAYVMDCVDVSMALGAFILGMILSGSKYGFQIHASVESTKTVLMSIFFVSVGMSIDFSVLVKMPWIFLADILVVLLVKMIVLFVVSYVTGVSKEASIKVSFLLSQGGEFGFVLFAAAKVFGIVDDNTAALGLGIISVSMAFTPTLYRLSNHLVRMFCKQADGTSSFTVNDEINKTRVIIAGYGSTGAVLAKLLRDAKIPFIIVDNNPIVVRKGKQENNPVYFGDITDPKLLNVIGIENVELALITLNDKESAQISIKVLRNYYPMLKIIVRSYEMAWIDTLIESGANLVVAEDLQTSLHIGSEALKVLGVDEPSITQAVEELRGIEVQTVYSQVSTKIIS